MVKTPLEHYKSRALQAARDSLIEEANRRKARGEGSLSRESKELCAIGAAQKELAVIDKERSTRGKHKLGLETSQQILRGVVGSTLGLGPVQKILDDPSVEEVLGRWDYMVIHRANNQREILEGVDTPWSSEQELVDWLSYAARTQGISKRFFEPDSPLLVMRLGPGIRLAAQREVSERVTFALRRNSLGAVTLSQLRKRSLFDPVIEEFLPALMRTEQMRFVISGGAGVGKTTLARACLGALPTYSHVIVVEETGEIDLFDPQAHPNVESWEARGTDSGDKQAISIEDLVTQSVRHRPDWNVVGETTGGDGAAPMIAAMTAGVSSLTTVNSNTAVGALDKLQLFLSMGKTKMNAEVAHMQLALAIDFVIHLSRHQVTGHRYVSEIIQVCGFGNGRCRTNSIYRNDGNEVFTANLFSTEMSARLLAAGFDTRLFSQRSNTL